MAIEIFGEGSDWERQGKKEGGARGAGDDGGVYKNKATKVTALIKKDDKIEFNIAEFLGSQLFAATEPGIWCDGAVNGNWYKFFQDSW